MRIVAGQFGGRKLSVPKGRDVRPTSDKVRGAIFNTLNIFLDIHDCDVLDAFCGTGALGLEALSRGAAHCSFIDKAASSIALSKENAALFGVSDICDFRVVDAVKVHLNRVYDLIFLDPPYRQDLLQKTLSHLLEQNALHSGSIVVAESEARLSIPVLDGFEVLKGKAYGDTLVTYLRYR